VVDRACLRHHRFIGYIEELIYAQELNYTPLVSPELEPYFASSNLVAQFQAAAAGGGLCVLPNFMAHLDPRLQRVLPETISLTRSFWLIVHSDMRDLARVRVVSEFIVREVRSARNIFLPSKT
jgi:DNA-binding transcriptional LysR family regulator